MEWVRRRDLEGGKEIGIWLLYGQNDDVQLELYVETHEYRGGAFNVYTATPDGEWNHLSKHDTADAAFEAALVFLEDHDATYEPVDV